MSFYQHAEVVSFTEQPLDVSPVARAKLKRPVTMVVEYIHDFEEDTHYYRAEVREMRDERIYYPGIGRTADEAIENVFESLLKSAELQVRLQAVVTSPIGLKHLRERRALIRRFLVLPDELDDELQWIG